MKARAYIADLFLTRQWFALMGGVVILFFLAFFIPALLTPAVGLFFIMSFVTLVDYGLLFFSRGGIRAERHLLPRFSLGDENMVSLTVTNTYPFRVRGYAIDELPPQFQERNFSRPLLIDYNSATTISYTLRPVTRGEYEFGNVLCYVQSPLRLLQRRFIAVQEETVKVYPSYQQLKRYQLMAVSDSNMLGIKKIRKLGHSTEFEKIKDYVLGDDVRTVNWKATARTGNMMVNTYTDLRQQQVYCIIDKGRTMKMPFEGMTLLDYSINSCLALLNVVLLKQDKAGLITFSKTVSDIIPAEKRSNQINRILETLYKQETAFEHSDYEGLAMTMHRLIAQRSLILLFTNFETLSSMQRQLPYIKKLAERHLVCAVFFRNTQLKEIFETQPNTTEGIYIKTIASNFEMEKQQIAKELRRHGILSVLTTPGELTVDVINKYIELKARQMI